MGDYTNAEYEEINNKITICENRLNEMNSKIKEEEIIAELKLLYEQFNQATSFVGDWAGNIISVERNIIEGYTEIKPDFK
ncbi:hypothetical protein [Piscibacillus salipiscarius]|nr:hypothetical protein [Piscibacillus salipiscarius]